MIYLNKGAFKPMLILISIILLPLSISCLLLTIYDFRVQTFIISLAMLFVYFCTILGIYKHSKTSKYYLTLQDNTYMLINYPNVSSNMQPLKLNYNEIIKMEYYKITSIKAWCLLICYVCPQCVYITYAQNGKEESRLIGYPKFEEIRALCADLGIDLIIK